MFYFHNKAFPLVFKKKVFCFLWGLTLLFFFFSCFLFLLHFSLPFTNTLFILLRLPFSNHIYYICFLSEYIFFAVLTSPTYVCPLTVNVKTHVPTYKNQNAIRFLNNNPLNPSDPRRTPKKLRTSRKICRSRNRKKQTR